MSKSWYGHHIETIKGEDYILYKDYLELDKEIERLNNIIKENIKVYDTTIDLLTTINTEFMDRNTKMTVKSMIIGMEQYLDKLKELKGSDSK